MGCGSSTNVGQVARSNSENQSALSIRPEKLVEDTSTTGTLSATGSSVNPPKSSEKNEAKTEGVKSPGDWSPFPNNITRLFADQAQALVTHSESVSDEESLRLVMRALQFFTASAAAMGGAVIPSQVTTYETSLGYLLRALYHLCRHRGTFSGGARIRKQVAEVAHMCVDKLYDWYVVQRKRKDIPAKEKHRWGQQVEEWAKDAELLVSYAQALQKEGTVGTGLLFEALCLQQGIAMLKDDTKEGLAIAGNLGCELVGSVLSMKPSPALIGAIAEGVKFGVKQNAKQRDGKIFELIFCINSFVWQVRTALQDPQPDIPALISSILEMEAQLVGGAPQWQVAYAWQKMLSELLLGRTGVVTLEDVQAVVASEGVESEPARTLQTHAVWEDLVAKQWLVPPAQNLPGSSSAVAGIATGIVSGAVGSPAITKKMRLLFCKVCRSIPAQLRYWLLNGETSPEEDAATQAPPAAERSARGKPPFRGLLGLAQFNGKAKLESAEESGTAIAVMHTAGNAAIAVNRMMTGNGEEGEDQVKALFDRLEGWLQEGVAAAVCPQHLLLQKVAPKAAAALKCMDKLEGLHAQLMSASEATGTGDAVTSTASQLSRVTVVLPLLLKELRALQQALEGARNGARGATRLLGEAGAEVDAALARIGEGAASFRKLACFDAGDMMAMEMARTFFAHLSGPLLDELQAHLSASVAEQVEAAGQALQPLVQACTAALSQLSKAAQSGSLVKYNLQMVEVQKAIAALRDPMRDVRFALLAAAGHFQAVAAQMRAAMQYWEHLGKDSALESLADAVREGAEQAQNGAQVKALVSAMERAGGELQAGAELLGEGSRVLASVGKHLEELDPVGDGLDLQKATVASSLVSAQVAQAQRALESAEKAVQKAISSSEEGLRQLLADARGTVDAAVAELRKAGEGGLAAAEKAVTDAASGVVDAVAAAAGPEFEEARATVVRVSSVVEQFTSALRNEAARIRWCVTQQLEGLVNGADTLEELAHKVETLASVAQDRVGGEAATLAFVQAGCDEMRDALQAAMTQMVQQLRVGFPSQAEGSGGWVQALLAEVLQQVQGSRELLTRLMEAAPGLDVLRDAARGAGEELVETVVEKVAGEVGQRMSSLREEAADFLEDTLGIGHDESMMLMNGAAAGIKVGLGALMQDDTWRVREGVINSLHVLQYVLEEDAGEEDGMSVELEGLLGSIRQQLCWQRAMETRKEVILAINSPDAAQGMQKALKQTWESQKEKVQAAMDESMRRVEELATLIADAETVEAREALTAEHKAAQEELEVRLSNLGGMEQQMGVAINFLKDMQKTLFRMEQKLEELSGQITELGNDVRYMAGKRVAEVFDMYLGKIFQRKAAAQKQVYIPLQAMRLNFADEGAKSGFSRDPPSDLMHDTMKFLQDDNAQLMLISGYSGSGKTTFMDKVLMIRLWEDFAAAVKTEGQLPYVPLFCSLPLLKQPLTDMIDESLEREFHFDAPQIREWKEALLQSPPRYGLILVLDSYDELKMEYAGRNLYDSNDIEEKAIKHKVIVTCRAEHLVGHDYRQWFAPMQTTNPNFDALAAFEEHRIAPFDSRLQEYVYAHSAHDFAFHVLPSLPTNIPPLLPGENNLELLRTAGFEPDDIRGQLASLHGMVSPAGSTAPTVPCTTLELYTSAATIFRQLQTWHADLPAAHVAMWALTNAAREPASDDPETGEGPTIKAVPLFIADKVRVRWTAEDYLEQVRRLPELMSLLSTPFMMEITVQILQRIVRSAGEEQKLKKQVLADFPRRGELVWKTLRAHKVIHMLPEIQRMLDLDSSHCPVLDRIPELEPQEQRQLRFTLRRKPITRYLIYSQFLNFWFEREVAKSLKVANGMSPDDLLWDVAEFSKGLAVEMMARNLSKVVYDQRGGLFRMANEWDRFFAESAQLRVVRQSAPLRATANTYQFIHKSILEYLVASQLLDHLNVILTGPSPAPWMLGVANHLAERRHDLANIDMNSDHMLRELLSSVSTTTTGKLADFNRRGRRMAESLQQLEQSPLNVLDVSSEEAVIDFVADRLLMETELVGQFHVAAALANCFPEALRGLSDNLWAFCSMPLPRRAGNTLLMEAVVSDAGELLSHILEVAKCLREDNSAVQEYLDTVSPTGLRAVHLCARHGHVGALRRLLEPFKADLSVVRSLLTCPTCEPTANAKSKGGLNLATPDQIPLHIAAMYGQIEVMEVLVNEYLAAANESFDDPIEVLSLQDVNGRIPLHLASLGGHVDAARLLMSKCQSLGSTIPELLGMLDCSQRNSLHFGAIKGSEPVIRALLVAASETKEIDLTEYAMRQDDAGRTSLHLAAAGGHAK
eukprot:gene4431-5440_t